MTTTQHTIEALEAALAETREQLAVLDEMADAMTGCALEASEELGAALARLEELGECAPAAAPAHTFYFGIQG